MNSKATATLAKHLTIVPLKLTSLHLKDGLDVAFVIHIDEIFKSPLSYVSLARTLRPIGLTVLKSQQTPQ